MLVGVVVVPVVVAEEYGGEEGFSFTASIDDLTVDPSGMVGNECAGVLVSCSKKD
jgi:hypothetical protein